MSWNYRIIRLKADDAVIYKLAEVYYDGESNTPSGWSEPFLEGDSIEELQEALDRAMMGAAKPPIDMEWGSVGIEGDPLADASGS